MKNKITVSVFLMFLALIMLLASCSHDVYWYEYRHTATGKHGYLKPSWGGSGACNGTYSRNPIKVSTYKRYYWASKHKGR